MEIYDHNQIEQQLLLYIGENSLSRDKKITVSTPLLRDGIFDSMGFVMLIDFIEDKFNIKTLDNEMIEANFESVASIVKFIAKKKVVK